MPNRFHGAATRRGADVAIRRCIRGVLHSVAAGGHAGALRAGPMGAYLPVADLRPVLGHMRQGGTTFYIPDICPIPSRDKLRERIEETLRDRNAPPISRSGLRLSIRTTWRRTRSLATLGFSSCSITCGRFTPDMRRP